VTEVKKGDRLSLTQPSNGGSWYAVRGQADGTEGWIESTSVRLERVEAEEIALPPGFVASKRPPVFVGVPGGVPAGVPGGVPHGLPGASPEIFGIPLDDSRPMEWKRYSPEGVQLSVDLPGEPRELSEFLPEVLRGSKMYATYRKDMMTVVARFESPRPIEDYMLTAGFTAMLSFVSRGSEVRYEMVSKGPNGTVMHGTATVQGIPMEVLALLSSKGTSAWMVVNTFTKASAGTSRDAADRIIRSVKLEPKTKSAPTIISVVQRPLRDVSWAVVLALTRTVS
jgi:hypothetical protein